MGRPLGSGNKKPYPPLEPERLKMLQTVNLKHGNRSVKFEKFLEDKGLLKLYDDAESLQAIADEVGYEIDLVQKAETARMFLLETYKKMGDIGVSLLNQLREVDIALIKLKDKFKGNEIDYLLNPNYIKLLNLRMQLSKEFSKLNLDKAKYVTSSIKSDEDVIDIKNFEVE
jgi:hypothetical protein